MKLRVESFYGDRVRRAPFHQPELQDDLLQRMQMKLRAYGAVDALHLDTHLWSPVKSGADMCEAGRQMLAKGHRASLPWSPKQRSMVVNPLEGPSRKEMHITLIQKAFRRKAMTLFPK